MIALLEPTEDSNVHTIEFTYPLRTLAAKLGVTMVPRQSPRTSADFEQSETVRNTEWNMAERLTEDRHRPVFDAFSTILVDGKEMATAQINLNEAIMVKGEGLVVLAQLLRDENNIDNAFARVLWDAVGRDHGDVLRGDFTLKHVFTVVSTRVKYGMKFDDSTVVEFSADSSDGTRTDGMGGKKTVYSFEFGVGHPGLTAGNTPTAMSMARRIAQFDSTDGVVPTPGGAVKVELERRPITRPYHVPDDLETGGSSRSRTTRST
jgi:hypothetical protein